MVVGVTLVIEASANRRVARASLIEKFCRVPPPSGHNRRHQLSVGEIHQSL